MAKADLQTITPEKTSPDNVAPKRRKSAGEVVFNRVVYTGIGLGVNEASSLWITDQFLHGKNLLENVPGLNKAGALFSEEGFNRASEAIAKAFKLTETFAKDGKKIFPKERAGNALLMVTLLSGGTLLLLPMKWLENNKIYWVKKANHAVDHLKGNKTPEQVAARDAEVEQHIACMPRQSWPGMLIGRILAVSASVAAGTLIMGPARNKKLMDLSEKWLTGSVQSTARRNALHRYARLASVETYSCATSALVLEVMSKFVSKRHFKPHDPAICEDTALTAAMAKAADTENGQDPDCGCAGPFSAKIQAQRNQAAGAQQALQA